MTENLLAHETSPYLLQHKDNPVHWRPWGKEALAEAERSNRPLLVSVGYAACHWCHVMAHESFEDDETAALMNALYVCIKVDREERPDIDDWLQKVLAALGTQGGWPLTAFLTPKGEPFWAGTYFPKEERFGLPPFKTVLRDVAQRYRETPDAAAPQIRQIAQMMEQAWYQNRSGNFDLQKLDQVAAVTAQNCDIFYGGVMGPPKFPNVPILELLWRAYLRTGLPQYLSQVLGALDNMGRGGIYDHVGGGTARYATDQQWLVPHFEKMLYDNAQLIDIMTLVWQHGKQQVLRTRVEETIAWALREMRVEYAGFASSLDADSEGEEGKFYLWSEAEIDAVLAGTQIGRFKQAYDVRREGNFPHEGAPNGLNILHRIANLPGWTEAEEVNFSAQRRLLLAAREKRVRPARDDKVLVDWNGLMIAALANAGAVFGQPAWIDAARTGFAFICEKLGEGDMLFHSYRAGKRQYPAFSDGYAAMARASLTLWEATGERHYFERAVAWTRTLDTQFWDLVQGGYVYSKNADLPEAARTRTAFDSQMPAANGLMAGVHGRLYFATLNPAYGERADVLIKAFSGDVPGSFMRMASFLNNFEFCATCMQLVVVGPAADPRTQELVRAIWDRSLPNRLLLWVPPGETLPAGHPAAGKIMQDGRPTAYICGGNVCSPPVTNAAVLSHVLQLPQAAQAPAAGNA